MKAIISFKGKDGFTLIEAMIAFAILGIGLLSLVGLFVSSMGATANGGKMTQAASIAQQELETLNSTAYLNITSSPNRAATWVYVTGSAIPYAETLVVTPDPNVANLKDITVTVGWGKSTATDRNHQISLYMKKAKEK